MPIKSSINALSSTRTVEIKKIIAPILPEHSRKGSGIIHVHPVSSTGQIIFIVRGPSQQSSIVEKSRFPTVVDNIFAHYHEVWIALEKTPQVYTLEKAYFHLYRQISIEKEEEYILLHSDPNESKLSPHYKYKCGPHLHFEFAPAPLPRAHIALNMTNLKSVTNNIKDLNIALHKAVELLRLQIIDSI